MLVMNLCYLIRREGRGGGWVGSEGGGMGRRRGVVVHWMGESSKGDIPKTLAIPIFHNRQREAR